jgi:biotin carboxyl carrier protein
MLQVKINGNKIIHGKGENNTIYINDIAFEWDLYETGEKSFHIIKNHQSYKAEIVEADKELKKLTLKINNKRYYVQVKDASDLILEKMGINENLLNRVVDVKAPMPGLIVSILVEEGQQVTSGEPLLVLEAMKMENVIKSPGTGVIRSIPIVLGKSVEKNQVLIKF